MTPKLQRIIDRTDKALIKALTIAITEIEREAKAAIKASPGTVQSFCIASGKALFNLTGGLSLAPDEFAQQGHNNNHAENIAGILHAYNGLFLITKLYPMLIQRDAATGEFVKLTKW